MDYFVMIGDPTFSEVKRLRDGALGAFICNRLQIDYIISREAYHQSSLCTSVINGSRGKLST